MTIRKKSMEKFHMQDTAAIGQSTPNVTGKTFHTRAPTQREEGDMELALEKEGDGGGEGGGFDGLNGTVFTSSHAGIFTPTFGERGTQRRHRKNKHRQERKRKKLMGKEKKNGVERLVQFLREGSPVMHKAVNKVINGQGQGHSAAGENKTPLMQIDWKKRQDGISTVEDHPTMGMSNGGSLDKDTPIMHEAGRGAFETQPEDPTAMNRSVEKKPSWNDNNYTVHKAEVPDIWKASTEATGIGPPTAQNTMAATGDHPQGAFTEESSDEEKRQQVITQNDFENRVKQYDNKENESGTVDQPRAAGAAASMTSYPDSSMQMMEKAVGALLAGAAKGAAGAAAKFLNPIPDEIPDPSAQTPHQEEEWNLAGRDNPLTPDVEKAWGSGPDTFDQDALHRGGDKDVSEDEEDIDEDKRDDNGWIPEDESKVKSEKEWLGKFEKLHKNSIEKGEINPILATLLALDND